jgi:hypothetical protein
MNSGEIVCYTKGAPCHREWSGCVSYMVKPTKKQVRQKYVRILGKSIPETVKVHPT